MAKDRKAKRSPAEGLGVLPDRIRMFGLRKVYERSENLYYMIEAEFLYDKPISYKEVGPYYLVEAGQKLELAIRRHKNELISNTYLQAEVELEDDVD